MKFWPLWSRSKAVSDAAPARPLYFFNSLGRELQEFTLPPNVRTVRMYNCGPTLYGRQHIGNLSMFVFADILRRVLAYNGFAVKQVINFTDFGHLSSDADDGDDKMTIGLKREGLSLSMQNMRKLADTYAAIFLDDISLLNVEREKIIFPYASDYVPAQIAMIQTLEEKGYAYRGTDGVYFDTSRFERYGELGGIERDGNTEARVAARSSKRHPTDFVLWKSSESLGWDSPWGMGFPGWHIECSAMIRAILGERIDIHTGGIEHVAIHHNNEIAQSECATGKPPLSRFWLHRAHLQVEGGKISKSVGNVIYLSPDITEKYHPLSFRYLLLGAHYRTPMNFSWESLDAAQTAFLRLRAFTDAQPEGGTPPAKYRERIHEHFNNDLDTAGALAVVWEMIKDESLSPADIRAGIFDADRVFGLGLASTDERAFKMYSVLFGQRISEDDVPEDVADLLKRRAAARKARNWNEADTLREEIEILGYSLEDASDGLRIYKRS
ncbi:cysteine--tRNA ligase [Candidatus Kaiserbacteria bacterium]|nr:cysteine--tRNA ligase [Candidatus Kaiserbacteria bacterium]